MATTAKMVEASSAVIRSGLCWSTSKTGAVIGVTITWRTFFLIMFSNYYLLPECSALKSASCSPTLHQQLKLQFILFVCVKWNCCNFQLAHTCIEHERNHVDALPLVRGLLTLENVNLLLLPAAFAAKNLLWLCLLLLLKSSSSSSSDHWLKMQKGKESIFKI